MKTFVKIFLAVVVVMIIASAVFAAPMKDSVRLVQTHYKNLLILKADKKFMGSTVEVHDSNGALITARELQKRKMLIDFYYIPYGAYTICVVKDHKKREFQYEKKQDSEILN